MVRQCQNHWNVCWDSSALLPAMLDSFKISTTYKLSLREGVAMEQTKYPEENSLVERDKGSKLYINTFQEWILVMIDREVNNLAQILILVKGWIQINFNSHVEVLQIDKSIWSIDSTPIMLELLTILFDES